MIAITLRRAIRRYNGLRGTKLTYETLARKSGLSHSTIEAIASRPGYNATLFTIDVLCIALECRPEDLLDYRPSHASKPKSTR